MSASALSALRQELARQGLDGFIVPRADEHLGEYVPPSAERLAWLTGFTGSAGLAVVLAATAAVFTDGRYVLQLAEQTDPACGSVCISPKNRRRPGWPNTRRRHGRIGYDPLLISEEGLARYTDAGLRMVPVERNPIDAVWTDRPAPPSAPAQPHPLALRRPVVGGQARRCREAAAGGEAGRGGADRSGLDRLAAEYPRRRRAVHPLRARLRAGPCRWRRPNCSWIPPKCPPRPGTGWATRSRSSDRAALLPALAGLEGQDRAGRSGRIARLVRAATREAGATVAAGSDPCLLPKACKNDGEQQGARAAHLRDAVGCLPLPALAVECRAHRHRNRNVGRRSVAGVPPCRSTGFAARASRRSPAPASMARSSIIG